MHRRRFIEASGALALAVAAGMPRLSTRAQATYSSVDLGMPDGYDSVVPVALNENGVAVVVASMGDKQAVFTVADGTFIQLGRKDSKAHATCIDIDGVVGGWIEDAGEDSESPRDIPIVLTKDNQAEMPGTPLDGRVLALQQGGAAVGEAATDPKLSHRKAVIWEFQEVNELKGIPNDSASAATDINGLGQIVGWVEKTAGESTERHAVMLSTDADPVEIGNLGGSQSEAVAISEQGHVAGNSTTAADQTGLGEDGTAAFLWQDGTVAPLLQLDGQSWSVATDVNSFGLVSGTAGLDSGDLPTTAVVWGFDSVLDLNQSAQPVEGITLTTAVSINELGQVLCGGVDASGKSHALLLSVLGN